MNSVFLVWRGLPFSNSTLLVIVKQYATELKYLFLCCHLYSPNVPNWRDIFRRTVSPSDQNWSCGTAAENIPSTICWRDFLRKELDSICIHLRTIIWDRKWKFGHARRIARNCIFREYDDKGVTIVKKSGGRQAWRDARGIVFKKHWPLIFCHCINLRNDTVGCCRVEGWFACKDVCKCN